jgi:hypothetical protein
MPDLREKIERGVDMRWKTKEYQFIIRGCSSIKDVHGYISEVNNCEFCNKSSFHLVLKNITARQKDFCTAIVEIRFKKGVSSKDAVREMTNCEFCHGDRDVLILKR